MSTDNRTQLNDCEDDTQTFLTTGSQLGTNALAGNLIEGAASIEVQHSNVYDDTYTSGDSAGATFNLDLSASMIWIPIKDNGLDLSTVAGAMIVVGDGTDRTGYMAGGSNALGLPYRRQFNVFKIDLEQATASPGTSDVDYHDFAGTEANLDQTQVTILGYGSLHNAKAQGNVVNTFIDGIYYLANSSYALTINGGTSGTPEGMTDVVGDDETNGWGLTSNPIADAFYFFGNTEWGDSGATDSYFTATDEQWFMLGDNGGGRPVGAGNHLYRLVAGTGTNSFVLTRVAITSTGEPAIWDFSALFETFELDGVVFSECGTITMPVTGGTSRFADNCIFNNCGQAYLSTLLCDGLTFNGTTDPLGAILWDANSNEENQDNLIFNSDGTGHAIEISLNTAALTTFNIDGYQVAGYETANDGSTGNTVFLVDNALDGDVTINVTNGVGTFSYERAAGYTGTVSIVQSVTVTITVVDQAGDPIQGAKVFLEEDPGGTDVIPYAITNASGQVTTSYTGTTPQAVTGYVRKGTVSPVYKAVPINDTIGATGLTATITMVSDE